jgi:hypothetical protein
MFLEMPSPEISSSSFEQGLHITLILQIPMQVEDQKAKVAQDADCKDGDIGRNQRKHIDNFEAHTPALTFVFVGKYLCSAVAHSAPSESTCSAQT